MIGEIDMDVISDKTDVLRILPEAAAELSSALFRNSPAGIYITRDGKFIYTNIEFRRITGYSQDELSGRDYQRLINPRYRQQPKQNIASLFEEDETTSHEFKITTKEGKKKWISEKITYFKYGGNWLTLGHWLDISEHHSIEKAWREAERRFQSAFEDLTTGLAIIGTDGIFLKVNKAFCDMLGYDEKDILESRFDQVIHPEESEACGDIMALFLSLEKPELPARRRLKARDGRTIWSAMSISLIGDSEGGPTYFIVHFQDITEQKRIEDGIKEEERLYRSLVDVSLEPVAVADLDGNISHVSQKFLAMLGYSASSELVGRKIGSLAKQGEAEKVHTQMMDILRQGVPGSFSAGLVGRDGAERPTALNISWVNDNRGAPAFIVISPREAVTQAQSQTTPDMAPVKAPAFAAEPEAAGKERTAPEIKQEPAPETAAGASLLAALEHTSTAFILIGADTTILAVNAAFEKMSGYPRREIEGKKSWIEFVAPGDQPRLKRYYLLRRLDPSSAPNSYEFKFLDRNGEIKDILINIAPVAGSDRQTATLLDVSEYKKALHDAQPGIEEPAAQPEPPAFEGGDKSLAYLDGLPESMVITDTEGIIIYASPKAVNFVAHGIKTDIIGKNYLRFIRPGLVEDAKDVFKILLDKGAVKNVEAELIRTDGQIVRVEVDAKVHVDEAGEPAGAVIVFKDITRQQMAEQAKDEFEKYFRIFSEHTTDVVGMADMDMHIIWISPSASKMLGYTSDEIYSLPLDKLVCAESLDKMIALYTQALEDEKEGKSPIDRVYSIDLELFNHDGTTSWVESKFQFMRDDQGKAVGVLGEGRDITDRRRAEDARNESEKYYRLLVENIGDVVCIMDLDLNFIWVSPTSEKISGYTPSELKTLPLAKQITPESLKKAMSLFVTAMQADRDGKVPHDLAYDVDLELYHKDGSRRWTANTYKFIRDTQGKATGILAQVRDITVRKKAEEDREESERLYRLLAEHITDVVWMMDLKLNFLWISDSSQKLRGYTNEETASMPLDKLVTPESLKQAQDLLAGALRDEEKNNLAPDRIYALDLEMFHKNGSTFWMENRFQFIRDEQGKATGFIAWGRDITDRKRAEETLEQSLIRLERTVEGSIQAIATVIEMRDPYTSGHQQRVARIAGAIAREMGLPDELIKCVEITGKIHDIGKIYVPMEILSKPGTLSNIERQIIQTHAKGSYDILKSIDFPWPVADTALQHHERLDGSGYPQGLKEADIMLEAKILMVADVVEAMASYRPYRASRGLDAALAEISNNSGILYDSKVAAACLRLFHEKGFSLEEQGTVV
jgi:PAS domain S-box-containing protein